MTSIAFSEWSMIHVANSSIVANFSIIMTVIALSVDDPGLEQREL